MQIHSKHKLHGSNVIERIMNWITEEIKNQVKTVFEPRYKRSLTDDEVIEIAESLANFMEIILKPSMKDEILTPKQAI